MSYTKIARATPFSGAPRINMPDMIGASPKKPVIIRIGAIGERPMMFSASGLPGGLSLSENIITGAVPSEGSYELTVTAENSLGKYEKKITLVIAPDTVQLTPLLGFTSWNAFGYEVSREKMEYAAKRMLESGISEYGYNFLNIDSGWQGEYGGEFDAVMPNEKFPDMKDYCDKMHANGLKCGIYSTPMLYAFGCSIYAVPLPPGCTQGEADPRFSDEHFGVGVIRKEKNNALQWADWGFDYLKYDWRPCDPVNADLMRRELVETSRDFGFCVTMKARPEYHPYWERYCSSYRCNTDSIRTWKNLIDIYRTYFDFIDYVNLGHYFDLDMLDIGDCDLFYKLEYTTLPEFGFTEDEAIVAFSMRAFLASPIQISTNFNGFDDFELSLYCNEEILDINQDTGFYPARPHLIIEKDESILHVLKKKLSSGDVAYAVFNLGEREETVKLYFDEPSRVRDVWAKEDLGEYSTLQLTLRPHTVRIVRVSKA